MHIAKAEQRRGHAPTSPLEGPTMTSASSSSGVPQADEEEEHSKRQQQQQQRQWPGALCAGYSAFMAGIVVALLILGYTSMSPSGDLEPLSASRRASLEQVDPEQLKQVVSQLQTENTQLQSQLNNQEASIRGQNTETAAEDSTAASPTTVELDLLAAWEASPMLQSEGTENSKAPKSVPRPPHLEDCSFLEQVLRTQDERKPDGSRPAWSSWGASASLRYRDDSSTWVNPELEKGEGMIGNSTAIKGIGPFPPWVSGSDEANLPLTRRVQRDLWIHQHPPNCSAPGVKFLVVNMSNLYMGVGAELRAIAGFLAIAIKEKRVLVIGYYRRADHDGCQGDRRNTLGCYFAPETSPECRQKALSWMSSPWAKEFPYTPEPKQNIHSPVHYSGSGWNDTGARVFLVSSPDIWGTPWIHLQESMLWKGQLVHPKERDSHRWFRAQALRYLMRYPSHRLCVLTNRVRHAAFGGEAARLLAQAMASPSAKKALGIHGEEHPLEAQWRRLPLFQGKGQLISIHVRQGDKGKEMIMHPLSDYVELASHIRLRFPLASNIWLATEMQSIVEETKNFKDWRFFFTNFSRQTVGSERMKDYEIDQGVGPSTDHAFVNLMIATSCDFFVGTMGSTWSLIIDDLRKTSGKETRGMLTVNLDRFWMTGKERQFIESGKALQKNSRKS